MLSSANLNKQKELKKLNSGSFLKSKGYYIDMVMLLIHPLPFFDPSFTMNCLNNSDKTKFVLVEYKMGTVLLSLMFVRIILMVRAVLNYSNYTDQHAKKLL
jgi:hypothetical protein